MKITKENAKELHQKLEQAIGQAGKECGLHLTMGALSYSSDDVSFQVTGCLLPENGESVEQAIWNKHATKHGFKAEDLGKTISIHDELYVIVGFDIKARVNKITIRNKKGTLYSAKCETILNSLNRTTAKDEAGLNQESLEKQFNTAARMLGVDIKYGTEFECDGERYRAVALNLRAPKYPLIGKNVKTQKEYKFPLSVLHGK